ncbi:hypothetical protein J437_LFUL008471 [Ladona fulva]|uniref:Pacifastin domain-containing protein n=1 Tax=Ladona fulva TaxID=123851 RepID=A0A8K0NZU9_LADFU|nr:hypothetical protein J437_LFUL008471 [Ladona fulva]
MKTRQIAFVALIAIFLVLTPYSAVAARTCQPGETWQEDCNSCHCTSTGLSVCTRRACLSNPRPVTT